jgi:hypothetical protein
MTSRECFAVAVRVIGLVVFIGGLRFLVSAWIVALHSQPVAGVAPVRDYLIPGLVAVVVGGYLIRGAPGLMYFAFPAKKGGEQPTLKSQPRDGAEREQA